MKMPGELIDQFASNSQGNPMGCRWHFNRGMAALIAVPIGVERRRLGGNSQLIVREKQLALPAEVTADSRRIAVPRNVAGLGKDS
jgi:hypothetical protein